MVLSGIGWIRSGIGRRFSGSAWNLSVNPTKYDLKSGLASPQPAWKCMIITITPIQQRLNNAGQ